MADSLVAPEPLNRLVLGLDAIRVASSLSIKIETTSDIDQNYDYSQASFNSNPLTRGENVNIAERYLADVTKAQEDELEHKWNRFIKKLEEDFYTKSQINKIIHNLDKKKQYSALHYAVWYNNAVLVEKLIDKKTKYRSNINVLTGRGEHVLHIIAQSNAIWINDGSYGEKSPNKRSSNQNEEKPHNRTNNLRIRSQSERNRLPRIVNILLSSCEKIDPKDNEGRTPLHLAVLFNRYDYVQALLHKNADISQKSILHNNVFHYVSQSTCTSEDKDKIFNYLMQSGNVKEPLLAAKNLDGFTPLAMAFGYGTQHMITTLLTRVRPILTRNEVLLCIDMLAKRSNQLQIDGLERILLLRYPLEKHRNLLHIICHYDNPKLLKNILDYVPSSGRQNESILEQYDENGYTPLLIAAYFGHKSMVKLLLERKARYLDVTTHEKKNILHLISQQQHEHILDLFQTNDFRQLMSPQTSHATPLHEICKTINVHFCKILLEKYTGDKLKLLKHQDSYGRTVFHQACEYGRLEMIKYLTGNEVVGNNQIELLGIGDDEKRTCLHLAAYEGHADVVNFLLISRIVDVNAATDKNETAFHYACMNGYRSVVLELLASKCDTIIRNTQLYNGLELAILNHNEDVARLLLLEYRDWRPMLKNAQIIRDTTATAFDTPIRKLIRYMPDLATDVIDQQFTRTSREYKMVITKEIYDYEVFEDQFSVKHWHSRVGTGNVTAHGAKVTCCGCFSYRTEYEPYTGDSYTLVRNHPLFIISDSDNQSLMEHPFCQALRTKKYARFGRYLLVLSFLLYLLYLIAFTAIVLRTKHSQYFYSLVNETSITEALCESVANRLVSNNITEALKDRTFRNLKIGLYVFLCLFIAKNVILILTLFPRLFRKSSYYLEAAALVLAFVYVFDPYSWLDPLAFRCPVQYQIGAFGLLLSWINFLVYVRCIPIIGIYVVMLEVISKKFIRFLPVLLVLIGGFGFTYYALLQNQSVYATPVLSLIKTSLIMFEMNFDDRIYKESEGGINYYPVTFVLFIFTGYIMTIFVINLLIGLAVGEIPTLVEQGAVLQSQISYDNLSDYEILRLQIRSLILWMISRICCCCTASFKHRLYRLTDSSFLRQRPILFQVRDRKQRRLPKRILQFLKKYFLTERIQESIDPEVKERYEKRRQTKIQRADDDQSQEKKELEYSKLKRNKT